MYDDNALCTGTCLESVKIEYCKVRMGVSTLVLAAVSSTVSFNGYVRCKSETKAIRDNNGLDTGSCLACIQDLAKKW